jgi:hypothetical protein
MSGNVPPDPIDVDKDPLYGMPGDEGLFWLYGRTENRKLIFKKN